MPYVPPSPARIAATQRLASLREARRLLDEAVKFGSWESVHRAERALIDSHAPDQMVAGLRGAESHGKWFGIGTVNAELTALLASYGGIAHHLATLKSGQAGWKQPANRVPKDFMDEDE